MNPLWEVRQELEAQLVAVAPEHLIQFADRLTAWAVVVAFLIFIISLGFKNSRKRKAPRV